MNQSLLFDTEHHALLKVANISTRVRGPHTIGGTLSEHGYVVSGSKGRVHMLYRFDQDDEHVPKLLPHCRWMPFVYGFYCCDYESGDGLTAYRVISDTEIQILSPKSRWSENIEFYSNYPESFPLHRVKLSRLKHNPSRIEDALKYSAVFGLKHLPVADYEKALNLVRPKHERLHKYGETDLGLEEFLAENSDPFMQGAPHGKCIWSKCRLKGKNHMQTIATIEGHPTNQFRFWSDTEDDPMMQLVYRKCDGCSTIYATQQAG